jgi:hypothetical protein
LTIDPRSQQITPDVYGLGLVSHRARAAADRRDECRCQAADTHPVFQTAAASSSKASFSDYPRSATRTPVAMSITRRDVSAGPC